MRDSHDHHHHPRLHRRGGFGGPEGFGLGFGGPGFGRGGRGGGPGGRRRRGDVRTGVLLLLKLDGPANGYQLIQGLTEKSEGGWTPSPGSVYPTLSVLEDEGLIAGSQREGESGTTFTLTNKGEEYIAGLGEIKAPWEDGPDKDHPAYGFRRAITGVAKASAQIVQDGEPEKITAAIEILNQARRDLYRILAEDDG